MGLKTKPTPLESFFDDIFMSTQEVHSKKYPKHNLFKKNDEYFIELAIAGYSPSDIGITIDEHTLIIESDKIDESGKEYLDKGISFKAFKRSFELSKDVDESKIEASFKNGILTITLPLLKEKKISPRIVGIDVA